MTTTNVDGTRRVELGEVAPAFGGLLGTDGRHHGLSDFAEKKAIVLIFDANRCPTAHAYVPRMIGLQRDYGPRGVQLIAVNSTNAHLYPDESYEAMVTRARESAFTFPYLKDADQALARALGVTCTFHVFVLDEARRVRYRGRFDDSRKAARVTTHDLRNALDDVLGGREVRVPETLAFGCALDLVGTFAERAQTAPAPVARDVICGMDVARTPDAITTRDGSTTFYFCSEACRTTFEAEPARYVDA